MAKSVSLRTGELSAPFRPPKSTSRTESTLRLAERLAPRCALAGIEIALVGSRGEVKDVQLVPVVG